jgi:hypothetical protein
MTEKAKENEVSRRDFIKDLSGSAIGAAIISACTYPISPAASDKVKVFEGMNKGDLGGRWNDIRKQTMSILNSLSSSVGARQVNWRLNVSGKVEPLPVFMDWVGTETVNRTLAGKNGVKIPDLGERRLGDGVSSMVYNQGLVSTAIVERDWNCDLLLSEKKVDSQLLVWKAGLMHQRFIKIIAQEPGQQRRCVGLLTVSFEGKPSNTTAVDEEMKKLASWPNYPKSTFVKYIEDNFVLGGPPA